MILSEDKQFNEVFDKAKQQARLVNITTPETPEQVIEYMRFWWSKHYNRPLKDPLLASYSLFELLYEFHLYKSSNNSEADVNEIITESKAEVEELIKEMDREMDQDFLKKVFG